MLVIDNIPDYRQLCTTFACGVPVATLAFLFTFSLLRTKQHENKAKTTSRNAHAQACVGCYILKLLAIISAPHISHILFIHGCHQNIHYSIKSMDRKSLEFTFAVALLLQPSTGMQKHNVVAHTSRAPQKVSSAKNHH